MKNSFCIEPGEKTSFHNSLKNIARLFSSMLFSTSPSISLSLPSSLSSSPTSSTTGSAAAALIVTTPPPKQHFDELIRKARQDLRKNPSSKERAEKLRGLVNQMREFYDDDDDSNRKDLTHHVEEEEEESDSVVRKRRRLTLQESHRLICPATRMVVGTFFNQQCQSPVCGDDCVDEQPSQKSLRMIATCKGHINSLAFSMDEKEFPTDTHTIETAMAICVYCVVQNEKHVSWPKSKPFAGKLTLILLVNLL
jgi:hypothetical protein